ncbi:MAG: DUF4351 domain-containing protein [Leptolyngbyaceae cyanobacterium SU_3_3]|nr:DUF4351 domain-containing protein [Leptolyngbyaceae cyanobacterium SU_3_3]
MKEQSLILRQLTRRIGDVSPDLQSQIQALTLDQLEALGEALLDFGHGYVQIVVDDIHDKPKDHLKLDSPIKSKHLKMGFVR